MVSLSADGESEVHPSTQPNRGPTRRPEKYYVESWDQHEDKQLHRIHKPVQSEGRSQTGRVLG